MGLELVTMTDKANKITPTAINLHQKSRVLEISFSDGFGFNYPCEYLRVYSPAAEVQIATEPVSGKSMVNITDIEQQGNYALRLFFDDGHDTGIYSWETLHELGLKYEKNWENYLVKLKEFNLDRGEAGTDSADENRTIKTGSTPKGYKRMLTKKTIIAASSPNRGESRTASV